MQRVATPGAPLRAVGKGRVDVGGELPIGTAQGGAQLPRADEVGGHAADYAPSVHGEAPLVDTAGEDLEGELEVGAHGRDGANDASRAARR